MSPTGDAFYYFDIWSEYDAANVGRAVSSIRAKWLRRAAVVGPTFRFAKS